MIVAPSLLAGDMANLEKDVRRLEKAGCEFLHLDIMDGHFVPNISFGSDVVKALRPHSKMVFDVHLMISDPLKYLDDFIKAGADYITFHYEAVSDQMSFIDLIKAKGVKVGISIKPGTSPEVLLPFLSKLDLILVMSVEPGFGGQRFMESSLPKIAYLAELKKIHQYKYLIQVDGGINDVTANLVKDAGCDVVVAGTYLLKHENLEEAVSLLQNS